MIPKKIICIYIFLVCFYGITFGQANYSGKNLTTEECLRLASKYEKEGDIKEATRYINTIGITSWENKEYSDAIDFFNRSIALNELIDNKGGISKLHSNLGMIYSDIREYEKSLEYFQLSLDYRLIDGESPEIISTYINKSVVLNNLEKYETAAENLEEALTLATEMNDAAQMKSCYGMLAETYEKSGNQAQMIHYFNLYKTFHEMIQRNRVIEAQKEAESSRNLAMQEELELKEKELELLEAYKEINEREEALTDLNEQAKLLMETNSKQELALSLLDTENKLNKSVIQQKQETQRLYKSVILTIIVGLIMSVLLILALNKNSVYKRKVNSKLKDQNKEISELNNNLESLVKARTEKLQKTLEQVELQNQNLDQFSSVISHNLRAPIASIMGLVNIFDVKNPSAPTNFEIFKRLGGVVENLDSVVTDLSTILEIRDNTALPCKNVEVNKVLESVKMQLRLEIEKAGISIELDDKSGPRLQTFKPYFENIIFNLLSNAIKYRTTTNPKVKITTTQSDEEFTLTVVDNGIGINKKHLPNIFMPYKRFNDLVEGKGLGLYMVLIQTETIGGTVEVSSELKKGTTFKISLSNDNNKCIKK